MTTVAYRDGVIAADTQSSRGQTVINGVTKIGRGPDGRLGGACGAASFCGAWLKWIAGEPGATPPEAKSTEDSTDTGLVIYANGTIELHEAGGSFQIDTPYYAMGSGRDQALGAMFCGAVAAQAVRAAIAHDAYSGGDVTVMSR